MSPRRISLALSAAVALAAAGPWADVSAQGGCSPGAAVTGGCAVPGGPRRATDADALPRVTCGGAVPARTRQAVDAQRALNRALVVGPSLRAGFHAEALRHARAGMAADSANALHPYLAGLAEAGAGRHEEAQALWRRAAAMCDGMGAVVAEARRAAYGEVFRAGLTAFEAGDTDGAAAAWTRAATLWEGAWEAYHNLGVLHALAGRPAEAVAGFRAAVVSADANADTAASARDGAAEARRNALLGILTAGTQLFAAERFADAEEVFRWLTERDPGDRDAWFNRALSLHRLQRWDDLLPVAAKVTEIDPLNHDARMLAFDAHKGLASRGDGPAEQRQRQAAVEALQAAEALPVRLAGMRIANADGRATFTATLEGAAARPGTPVALAITFHAPDGPLGTATVVVAAPARGATATVEAVLESSIPASAVSYTVR